MADASTGSHFTRTELERWERTVLICPDQLRASAHARRASYIELYPPDQRGRWPVPRHHPGRNRYLDPTLIQVPSPAIARVASRAGFDVALKGVV